MSRRLHAYGFLLVFFRHHVAISNGSRDISHPSCQVSVGHLSASSDNHEVYLRPLIFLAVYDICVKFRSIRFSSFENMGNCLYITIDTDKPRPCPLPVGGSRPPLTQCDTCPRKSSLQMASRSVQPFLHNTRALWSDDRPRHAIISHNIRHCLLMP